MIRRSLQAASARRWLLPDSLADLLDSAGLDLRRAKSPVCYTSNPASRRAPVVLSLGKAVIVPETRSISASRWLGFGGGFANSMSGPAFVEGAIFSAAVVCLLGHVHLHLVDAEFDGPTGIVLRKYASLLSSIVATRSCPSGLWQKRNLKFPPRRPRSAAQQFAKSVDQEYAHFADGEPRGPRPLVME